MTQMTKERLTEMVMEIDEEGEGLTVWEVTFIAKLIDNPPERFTLKQAEQIEKIHTERLG